MIDHSGATWGQTRGNPIFEEQRQAAALCPPDLIVNVALDAAKAITDVFCGELTAAHDLACRSVAKSAIVDVDERFDLVITSNSGFPLDQNFYQAVKGLSAAARIVKPGGALVIASECSQGIGHGHFAEYLQRDRSPSRLLAEITAQPTPQADQWQAQILAQIQSKASVYVHSTGLDARAIRQIGCIPCPDISELADQLSLAAPNFAIAALPDGPLTIAQIAETAANEIAAKNL